MLSFVSTTKGYAHVRVLVDDSLHTQLPDARVGLEQVLVRAHTYDNAHLVCSRRTPARTGGSRSAHNAHAIRVRARTVGTVARTRTSPRVHCRAP
jgi:hypothetical protein